MTIRWDPETGETFKGPSEDGPWTAISREEFDVRMEHRDCPLPLDWEPTHRVESDVVRMNERQGSCTAV